MNNCNKCNEPVNGNYCSNCGHSANLERINLHYIVREIASAFYAEKGILYTTKKMLISPGKSIRQYISEDRSRYVKPILFLIITSLIYTLAHHFSALPTKQYSTHTMALIMQFMVDYHGYSNIITGLFVAFWIKLFFRKSEYNIFEIFILLCFILGILGLFSAVALILYRITHVYLIIRVSTFIELIYLIWAIGQFFDKKKAASYIKAVLSCFLGYFVLGLLLAIIVVVIDKI